jgi:hypothetical protein
MVAYAEVGLVTSYIDEDVKDGKPYYYKVVATSGSGDSERSRMAKARVEVDDGPGFGVLAVISAMLVTIPVARRRWVR